MSQPGSSSMTVNDTEKSCTRKNPEAGQETAADQHTENGSDGRSSAHKGVRERVLKEVGLTSSAFIGPAFPPQTNAAKSDIEDSLSEFYKELEKIDPPDAVDGNPRKRDAGHLLPQKAAPSGDHLREEERNVYKRNSVERDGYQENIGRRQPRPHWYENEPYHQRRQRPAGEFNPARPASEPSQWDYPRAPNMPPSSPFHRPTFPPQRHSPEFLSPQPAPSFHGSGASNQHQNRLHPSSFPGVPPQDVSSHPSWDFYEDSPVRRDQRRSSYDPHLDPLPVEPCFDRNEGYDHVRRFDAYDEVWDRNHHYETRDSGPSRRPALVLILMRGLPGSGKSTRARELLSMGPDGVILSTDDFFALSNGYRYEAGLLGAAHEWNQKRAKDALREGRSPIIIDNTNLQAWEMKPYVEMALHGGYRVDFCEPDTSWKFDPYELERRNKHGVPHDKIARMLDRFSYPISVQIVLNSEEPPHVTQRR